MPSTEDEGEQRRVTTNTYLTYKNAHNACNLSNMEIVKIDNAFWRMSQVNLETPRFTCWLRRGNGEALWQNPDGKCMYNGYAIKDPESNQYPQGWSVPRAQQLTTMLRLCTGDQPIKIINSGLLGLNLSY